MLDEQLILALIQLVLLAMLLERALVLVFDYHWFREILKDKGIKAPIALVVAWVICKSVGFDVIGVMFRNSAGITSVNKDFGIVLTAMIVAGGSAGAITLFQGVLGFSNEAQKALKAARDAEAQTRKERAQHEAEIAKAEAQKTIAAAALAEAELEMKRKQLAAGP